MSIPDNFRGKVEFRIWDAVGVLLSDINPQREETELLINAGTLFKVIWRQTLGDQEIIELQQIK